MLCLRCCLLAAALLLGNALAGADEVELAGPTIFRLPPVDNSAPPEPIPPPAEVISPALEEVLPAEAVPPEDGDWWLFPASWYKPWEGSVELGLNGTEGNSQTFNIRSGAKAKFTQPWVEQSYEVLHVDNSAEGVKTALNGYFDGRIEFPLVGSKWSHYAHTRFEYDDFRDYGMRASGDTGLAYDWWKTNRSKLQSRGGISTSREIGGAENRFQPEVTFGIDLNHKFDDRQKLSLTIDYYPTVDDFLQDYRINTNASWEIVVSQAWGLSAKLSVIDRYDNTPQGRRPNDINYAALMLWSF